ncbi:presqualene diphosphate synthase HpnD [Lignipirellula cremea]|uniref:All-trans-phytoene synthase n=1 Tax=Lignipirellula cremea TaxID=2528010 RepID=A0A518DN65_9BACT|nr:presqualene diphosphate synthase HpnD [Lignipirellula cremea]QDU93272.1 All-trans-phytoene synthase [Lignipirellula cremea]
MTFFTGRRMPQEQAGAAAAGLADPMAESYRQCAQVARQASSNFYYSFWLLPAAQRQAMCALYAFSRHTDDLGDSELPVETRRSQLAAWKAALTAALAGDASHPLLRAVADMVRRFSIPEEYLHEIIRGVEMDLDQSRYATFAELEQYCYRVASAVGLACLHIWGFEPAAARQPALQCGLAFQLTNILRDLHEDGALGRIYLPLEDLERFDYAPTDLLQGVVDERYLALMQFEIERAEQCYRQAEALLPLVDPAGRRMLWMMHATYRRLLHKIAAEPAAVFARKVRVSYPRKLQIAVQAFWRR